MRQRSHSPTPPDCAQDPAAITMSRRSVLAMAGALAAEAAVSPFLWPKVQEVHVQKYPPSIQPSLPTSRRMSMWHIGCWPPS